MENENWRNLAPEKQESVMGKIQKLIALAASANEHEAESAMRHCGHILQKWNLSMEDIRGKDETDMINLKVRGRRDRCNRWEAILCNGIAQAFGAKVVMLPGFPWHMSILGVKQDVEMVKHFYIYLRTLVPNWADNNISRKQMPELKNSGQIISAKNSYCRGMTSTICKRMVQLYEARKEVEPNTSLALIRVREGEVAEFLNQEFPKLRSNKSAPIKNGDAFMQGLKDGKDVSLVKPIEGGENYSQIN